jgi:hypothetical protein
VGGGRKAAALALVAIPTTLAGPGQGSPCAPAAQVPYAPGPLQVNRRDQDGVHIAWKDTLNDFLGIAVDSYLIFRAPPGPYGMEPIAQVAGSVHEFVDGSARVGDYTYWVAAHNCQGVGQSSNPASTSAMTCVDWGLSPTAIPPLQWVWVDPGCTSGSPCVVVVHVYPAFYVDRAGCGSNG